jgi:hypothetical protein
VGKMIFQKLDLNKEPVNNESYEVQFNPTEFGLSKSVKFADVTIPGLDSPITQFVNGETEKLTMELFFDTTLEGGTGADAVSVTTKVDPFYRLVKVDGDMHAPPIVRITWGEQFPGMTTDQNDQPMAAFDCVVERADRTFTLFNSDGVPLRCTVALTLREYRTLEEQLTALNLRSADHTRVYVVREGDTLPQIAYNTYQDPARWRTIAEHNDIRNPRQLKPGTVLHLPPVRR